MTLKAYWWDPKRSLPREFALRAQIWLPMLRSVPKLQNFGDSVNPIILRELTGHEIAWARMGHEDLVGIGSNLDAYVRHAGQGLILGTGVREPNAVGARIPRARILGVRGRDTARAIGVEADFVVGDPGLLISEVVKVQGTRSHSPVFVPHLRMLGSRRGRALIRALAAIGYTIVLPNNDPVDVAREVANSSSVLATSLHALVFADSYGVPCARLDVPWLNEPSFKFGDYRSAFGTGLTSVSISEALSGVDINALVEQERHLVADRLHGILRRLDKAAEALRH